MRFITAIITIENYDTIFNTIYTFFLNYLAYLLSVCAFRIIVLIRFYQNKKMLLLIPDNNFLMDGTTENRAR